MEQYSPPIVGTDAIQPPDARLPKLRRECTIRIGRPVRPDRYRSRSSDRLVYRQERDRFQPRTLFGEALGDP